MGEPKKVKKKSGNSSIRSPSSKDKKAANAGKEKKTQRKYTDSEKLSICVLYEFVKSTDRVAEMCGMEGSSVRYIVNNNKKLREKAKELAIQRAEEETRDFVKELKENALNSIKTLLFAITEDVAIGKSNSQQLAIAMATLMDKFSILPGREETKESGGVIVLPEIKKG